MAIETVERRRIGGIEVDGATVAIAEADHFDATLAANDKLVGMADASTRWLGILRTRGPSYFGCAGRSE